MNLLETICTTLPTHLICLTLYLQLFVLDLTSAGSCWRNVNRSHGKKTCADLISAHITKKECCKSEPYGEKFYSDDQSTFTSFDLKFYLTPHKCGVACNDGCSTFQHRCKENERCKIKNGIPRCLCDPMCAKHSLRYKGRLCGSDGLTYRSHCQLLRQNCRRNKRVVVNYLGRCKAYSCKGVVCARKGTRCVVDQYNSPICVDVPDHCTTDNKPDERICATNNRTFSSMCLLNRYNVLKGRQLRLQYNGPCQDSMICDKDPLCKRCLHDVASGSHICFHDERCADCSHVTDSPLVCGRDGVTYENECIMRQTACLNGINISVKHIDSCNASEVDILWTAMHAKRGLDDVFKKLINQTLSL